MIFMASPRAWSNSWLSEPGRPDGWRVLRNLLGQNEFSIPGDAQIIFLILVHDHNFVASLKQMGAFNARLLVCRRARRGSVDALYNRIHFLPFHGI
jgi:hypothetical protein